jgi:hypothetical protein
MQLSATKEERDNINGCKIPPSGFPDQEVHQHPGDVVCREVGHRLRSQTSLLNSKMRRKPNESFLAFLT